MKKRDGDFPEMLDGFSFDRHALGVPKGMMPTPEEIFLKSREVCKREKCEFRRDYSGNCMGAKNDRQTEYVCNYGQLVRNKKQ